MELINKTKSSLVLSVCMGVASYSSFPANTRIDAFERHIVMDSAGVEEGFCETENSLFCKQWQVRRDQA